MRKEQWIYLFSPRPRYFRNGLTDVLDICKHVSGLLEYHVPLKRSIAPFDCRKKEAEWSLIRRKGMLKAMDMGGSLQIQNTRGEHTVWYSLILDYLCQCHFSAWNETFFAWNTALKLHVHEFASSRCLTRALADVGAANSCKFIVTRISLNYSGFITQQPWVQQLSWMRAFLSQKHCVHRCWAEHSPVPSHFATLRALKSQGCSSFTCFPKWRAIWNHLEPLNLQSQCG